MARLGHPSARADIPVSPAAFRGLAIGDFWGEQQRYVAIAADAGSGTQLTLWSWSGGTPSLVVTDAAADLPSLQMHGLVAADYEKDGFDTLTLLAADGSFQVRVAPRKPNAAYDPGPEYNGKAYSGQLLPGNGAAASVAVMHGTLGATANARSAFAAGRIFGYVNTDLNTRFPVPTAADAQIAFAHRRPTKDLRPPYGWPNQGETVSFDINLNNTGAADVPAGAVRLRVWVNRANRNADSDPATCDAPDYDMVINEALPAYNSASPVYVARTVSFPWPYGLTAAGPRATWQKLDLAAVGERWVVATIDWPGDANLRNNRYEMALHSLTFHPILRTWGSLADREPTVAGDPGSKEYLCRKIADAVQSMWERSQTRDGQPALQRLWFDSYEVGWPDDAPDPGAAWQAVQAKYEGWRELDGWWGINQNWERFDWQDGGAELHETGHLFTPLGDLYQYVISPVFTAATPMSDGTPVQLATYCWGADSYSTGATRLGWPASEMMHRLLVGVRNNSIMNWESLAPDRTLVRVLDRDGNPVSGAQVRLYTYGDRTPYASGVTGGDGRWDTTPIWEAPTLDAFGRKHYFDAANHGLIHTATQIFTVQIGAHYQDSAIWDTTDTASHGRHTYMGHSLTDEAEWTWDIHTNYAPGAAAPTFDVVAAVQGNIVTLGVTGTSGATYRLYRRWEPAYIRTLVGEYPSAGNTCTITQDLTAPDSHRSGRFRAIYEITQLAGGETLPRVIQVTGLTNATGLTARSDGKLLVAANAGIANPFCQLFDGTTPYSEFFYHFRFGHTANKVAPSLQTEGKYYATLSFSDMTPEYSFDLINPPTQAPYGYDVRNDIVNTYAVAYSTSGFPYTIQCPSAAIAALFLPGDTVDGPSGSALVQSIANDTLTVRALIFPPGLTNPGFSGQRTAGQTGSGTTFRNLRTPRGLAILSQAGREYVAIADTGNRRIVVWDDRTAYMASWTPTVDPANAKPVAVATDPNAPNQFFVLDRRTSGGSNLYLVTFNGTSLTTVAGYPVMLPVSDYPSATEMGLAAALDPQTGARLLLVTSAANNRVLEFRENAGTWQAVANYTAAIGIYAGTPTLRRPTDAAFVRTAAALARYALDGNNRVVLLASTPLPRLGDLNCDGSVDFGDINPFVLALSDPAAYAAQFPDCNIMNGDCNGNGRVEFGDITPFVALLTDP